MPTNGGCAMPEASEAREEEPRRFPLRITEEFIDGLARIYSKRVLDQIKNLVSLLETASELGSSQVRPALTARYGKGIRKLPVSTFIIVYRFDGQTVDVLALVYGPTIK